MDNTNSAARSRSELPLSPLLSTLTVVGGLALVFIGLRFLVAPTAGAEGFGVQLGDSTAYGAVKGIRDVFSGALLIVFGALRDRRAAVLTLGLGALVPLVDGAVVLAFAGPSPLHLSIHWGTAAVCLAIALTALIGVRRGSRSPVAARRAWGDARAAGAVIEASADRD